jgi:hypothetical protein
VEGIESKLEKDNASGKEVGEKEEEEEEEEEDEDDESKELRENDEFFTSLSRLGCEVEVVVVELLEEGCI